MPSPLRMRLVASFLLCCSLVAFFYMWRISTWTRDADGSGFVSPDGATHVKGEILPVLGQIGGAVAGIGIVLLILSVFAARRRRRMIAEGKPLPQRARISVGRRLVTMVVVIVVSLVGTLGYRWYDYVTNAPSPYDEIGIDVNSRLPGPLRSWGCAQLHSRFAQYIPPYGCADETGRAWRDAPPTTPGLPTI